MFCAPSCEMSVNIYHSGDNRVDPCTRCEHSLSPLLLTAEEDDQCDDQQRHHTRGDNQTYLYVTEAIIIFSAV